MFNNSTNNLFKTTKILGENYVIKKFDARTGLKLARVIIAKILPALPAIMGSSIKASDIQNFQSLDVDKITEGDALIAIAQMLDKVSGDDIDELLIKCLSVCEKKLDSGNNCPVIDLDGHFGVPEVEYDIKLTVLLCVEALKWGAGSFFSASSQSSEDTAQDSPLQKLRDTMSSSLRQ